MFAPVTRVELEAALAAALEPIRKEFAKLGTEIQAVRTDVEVLRGDVGGWREHCATKAEVEPLRADLASLREHCATKAEIEPLRADLASLREHCATKADVKAMGLNIVMWVGGLLAVFVAVMGWLVGRT